MSNLIEITSELSQELTKQNLERVYKKIMALVTVGNASPLETHAMAKAIGKVMAQVAKETQADAMLEAQRHHKDDRSIKGAAFAMKNLGRDIKYDQDEEVCRLMGLEQERWTELTKDPEFMSIKQKLKARMDLVKAATENPGAVIVDPETGEQVEPVPVKEKGETIAVSFK